MDDRYYHEEFDGFEEFFHESSGECTSQVAVGTFRSILPLIMIVLTFKGLKNLAILPMIRVYFYIVTTSMIVAWFSTEKLESMLIFNLLSVVSLKCAEKKIGGYSVLAANIAGLILLQIYCQQTDADASFLSIRGILMMHIMRLTTVAFQSETDRSKTMDFRQLAEFLEYVYFPPFIVFGPYLTFKQYTRMRNIKWSGLENELGFFIRAITIILIGLTFAVFSSCHFDMYTPTTQFIEDATTAMSFRFSHYFICLTTQAFIVLLGSHAVVVNPMKIEFSRSTLQTVAEWNKPFHQFLHEYVFQRQLFKSRELNVLLTFLVSSFLHGLDFQMSITLLCLGFIAYAETVFRKRLADRLSMCIAAKPCSVRNNQLICNHKYTSLSAPTLTINFFFYLLTVYHLIFTGMTFTDDYSATGYPFSHAWNIWGSHYYASLIISFGFLGLAKVL